MQKAAYCPGGKNAILISLPSHLRVPLITIEITCLCIMCVFIHSHTHAHLKTLDFSHSSSGAVSDFLVFHGAREPAPEKTEGPWARR